MSKELPILFSTPMVQAILEGRKTQTRRIRGLEDINDAPDDWNLLMLDEGSLNGGPAGFGALFNSKKYENYTAFMKCPYGRPGDRLWVRETWAKVGHDEPPLIEGYIYKADEEISGMRWRPSIHMPKAAARIWLEVESVGVERLQAISWDDAVAEGCSGYRPEQYEPPMEFRDLWKRINGPESWEQNPWVWIVKFKRIEK